MSPSEQSSPPSADCELQAAREHLRAGRSADAEQSYRRVLDVAPDSIEALVFLGNAAQARGDGGHAVNLLSRASKADPANVDILLHLGAVYRAAERFDAARYVLERAVRLAAGRNLHARLSLASVLEVDQRPDLALLHYCRALIETQRARQRTSEGDKAAGLQAQVAHAKQYVDAGRRVWFERVLRDSGQGAASGRGGRIEAALAAYLDGRPPMLSYPQQRAGLMHVPGVATAPFIDNARFDWLDRVPEAIARCVGEMGQCVASSASSVTTVGAGALRVHVFKAGVLQYEPRRHAPRLLSVLRELPLADVQHHAPDVDIIALNGGARFARHYGRTNSFCWAVVNPVGSAAFQVSVGGESRMLPPAAALVADPSFGVEYLNAGEAPALALAFEIWHPDLSDTEQRSIAALIAAVLDFDNRLQELD